MKKRIWFNRTFSTAIHFIDRIRDNPEHAAFEFFATHPKRHSVMLQYADYAEIEPTLPAPEYIEYCVDFCRRNQIDIFIPNYRLVEIANHLDRFEEAGTSVLVGRDASLLAAISDKGRLFEELRDIPGLILPDYFIVNTAEQFLDAYEALKKKGHEVCFKPAQGEGGAGFHVVVDSLNPIDKLLGGNSHLITPDDVCKAINGQTVADIMVMEYLDGYEYSIDCLATESELLACVPRKKVEGRIRMLEDNKQLIEIAKKVHERLRLPYMFNIQVK